MKTCALCVSVVIALFCAGRLVPQMAQSAADPNGVSVPYPLHHLFHSDDPALPVGTAWLRTNDPFLLYQLGRDLTHRIYSRAEGAIDRPGALDVPLYAGERGGDELPRTAARFARDHAASCGFCHSMPPREPGAGQTIASTSTKPNDS